MVPIALDSDGPRVDILENVLKNWDTLHPGKPFPKAIYTYRFHFRNTHSLAEKGLGGRTVSAEYNQIIRFALLKCLFFSIPTGQNPSGCTATLERREQIYSICSKYDILIFEVSPFPNLRDLSHSSFLKN